MLQWRATHLQVYWQQKKKKKLNSVSYCRGGNLGKEKEEGKFEGGSGLDLGEVECDQNTLYTSLKYSKLNKKKYFTEKGLGLRTKSERGLGKV